MIRHLRRIQYIVVRNAVGQGVNGGQSPLWGLTGDRVPCKKSVSDDETHTYAACAYLIDNSGL
jgi:hypothetical protein